MVRRYRPLVETLESRLTPSVLFVDQQHPGASDTGSGTAEQPFRTIGAAATRAIAGDTVQVASGTYTEQVTVPRSGTASAPIVFTAADGATVTVKGGTHGFYVSAKSWITIRGFFVTQTSGAGINVVNSSNITIAANDVSLAGQPLSGFIAQGIKLSGTTSSLVEGNKTHHNTDAGVSLTSGTTGVTVRGNESFANARGYTRAAPGIDIRSGGNTIIANHTHHNEDTGIQIVSATGTTEAANNFIINNISHDNGDHGMDALRAPGQTFIGNVVFNNVTAGINIEGGSTGTRIANNISVDNGIDSPRTEGNIRVDIDSTTGTTMDYDVVWLRPTGTTQYMLIWGSVKYTSLAAFVAATGMETHGLEADPKWVNPAAGDFHLQAGSPAIDSANSGVSGQTATDADGKPRIDDPATANTGAGPRLYDDRGAYEFQPAAPPPPPPFLPGTISGFIFEDHDGDAVRDASDQGLGGRTAFLDANANAVLDSGEASTTTATDGSYQFTGLASGTYRVRQVRPTGWRQTTANPADVTLGSGQTAANINFGNFDEIIVSGIVFQDNDGDAVRDPEDQGLSGWTVFLDDNNNAVLDAGEASRVSGTDGGYQFANLGPGTYRVRQVNQAGWTKTTADPAAIFASSGINVASLIFGNAQAAAAPGSLTGRVFEDHDGDGALDSGDQGLGGWSVYLDADGDGVRDVGEATTVTDGTGAYSFSGLSPATYRPRLLQQSGWLQTTPNADVLVSSGATANANFEVFKTISASGLVFQDADEDGVRDAGEPAAGNLTVYLDSNQNGLLDTTETRTSTAVDGSYRLSGIGPGILRIRLALPSGWTQTTANPADSPVSSGVDVIGKDFGAFNNNITISGVVFRDRNGDGIRGSRDNGLGGWTVFLDANNNGKLDTNEIRVVTDSNGRYTFTGLAPGTYRVRVVQKNNWRQTTANPIDIIASRGTNVQNINFGFEQA